MPMTPIMNHIIVIIPSRARGDHGREERKEADKMRSNMPIVDTSCMQDHHGGRSGGLGSESLIHHDFAKTVRTELRIPEDEDSPAKSHGGGIAP